MSAQHTQGRLVARTWACHAPTTVGVFLDKRFQAVAECGGHGLHSMQHAADARRIAACWNACDGLSTEGIEAIAALGGVQHKMPVTAALLAERDALLAAAIVAREFISTDRNSFHDCNIRFDGTMEPDDVACLADYDAALLQIDAAIKKAAAG